LKRLAIITGAGSGLGRAFCRALIAIPGDWHIVLVDIDVLGAQATLSELGGGSRISGECEQFDVADADRWFAVRDRLQRDWPRVDLVVNNAGVCMSAEVGDGDLAAWRQVFDVNFQGVLNGCHVMTPWLKRSAAAALERPGDRPAVINIASIMGLLPTPALGAYCASKAAVIALSEVMNAELQPHGVNVTVAAPGFFESSLLDRGAFAATVHRRQADEFVRTSRIDANFVARETLRASARGELYAVMGSSARWYWRLKRLAPSMLVNSLSRRYQAAMREGNAVGSAD
jgi:NAD(P)-dependent dehydrogenase (short-subunit alcohol dehydrogenase family)